MAGGEKDSRTEKPTRRKLEKAREKGQVARSREVPSAAVLLGGLLIFTYFGKTIQQFLEVEMRHLLDYRMPAEITVSYLSGFMSNLGFRIAMILFPILLALMLFSVAANLVQGGLAFSSHALGFRFEKLNPKNGLEIGRAHV